jgi:hypothetical protein
VRLTPPTLSLAFAIAIAGLSIAAPLPPAPAQAAAPAPAGAKPKAATPKSNDPCGSAKSKWAHLKCEEFNASAPGDEYFGRMKLSYLGIDNTYKDGSISAGDNTTDPHLIAKLDFATEALRRWAAKYPNDPQLAHSYFLGVLVLRKVYTQQEQQTSWEFTQLLVKKYPKTYFGKTAKASMAQGYLEHWYALAEICPTPLPRGAKAQPTPDPTPTASPVPGKPYVELIAPTCVPPSPAVESPAPSSSAPTLTAPASAAPQPSSR